MCQGAGLALLFSRIGSCIIRKQQADIHLIWASLDPLSLRRCQQNMTYRWISKKNSPPTLPGSGIEGSMLSNEACMHEVRRGCQPCPYRRSQFFLLCSENIPINNYRHTHTQEWTRDDNAKTEREESSSEKFYLSHKIMICILPPCPPHSNELFSKPPTPMCLFSSADWYGEKRASVG